MAGNLLSWSSARSSSHIRRTSQGLSVNDELQRSDQVLSDYVDRDELTEDEAVKIVERAFFHNANELYQLNLTPHIELTAS